jgi:hypothetical protein
LKHLNVHPVCMHYESERVRLAVPVHRIISTTRYQHNQFLLFVLDVIHKMSDLFNWMRLWLLLLVCHITRVVSHFAV